jgi:hypothetical protein
MENYINKSKSLLISILTSILLWILINKYFFEIQFIHYISLEIILGITAGFVKFVKIHLGLKT